MSTESGDTFVPANRAAQWTKGLLIATLVASAVGIVSDLLQVALVFRAATGGISHLEATASDTRQQIIAIFQLILYIGTAVAFLRWFYRVHKNLPALGVEYLHYTPGWAVGGFFVPFLNLIRPLQVMREVWHGSDPSGLEPNTGSDEPSIRSQPATPALAVWWWALFLISNFLGYLIFRMGLSEKQTLHDLQTLCVLIVFSDLLRVPAAVVTVLLVGRITGWQAQRAESLRRIRSQRPGASVPGPG